MDLSILPKVSIITPVYNVDKFLCQCLNSIINQTLQEIEIICINDGSIDSSLSILKEFMEHDSRIVLINKINCGYGAAMNDGLSRATGEYIGIVEPDDFVDNNMFQILYSTAKQYQECPDIVKAAYWEYQQKDGETVKKAAPILNIDPPCNPFNIYQFPDILNYHPCTVTAIYRHEFLEEKGIRYIEAAGAAWTDNPFFFSTMCQAKSIVWVPSCLYYYRQDNPGASSYLKDCRIPFRRLTEVFDFIETSKISDERVLTCLYKRVFLYYNGVLSNPHYSRNTVRPIIKSVMLRIQPDLLNNEIFNRLERYYYKNIILDKSIVFENKYWAKINSCIPNKILKIIQCFLEHGIIYTFQYIYKKIF